MHSIALSPPSAVAGVLIAAALHDARRLLNYSYPIPARPAYRNERSGAPR